MLSSIASFVDSERLIASKVAFSIKKYRAALPKKMFMAAVVSFQI